MTTATEYLGVAALLMLFSKDSVYPEDRAELSILFEGVYQWKCDELSADRIVRQLESWGALIINRDRYAGETFRIYKDNLREARALISGTDLQSVLSSADYGGAPWFKRVFGHQEFWNELYSERNQPIKARPEPLAVDLSSLDDHVPAADRIVARTDNADALAEIADCLNEISNEIHSDNEVGSELGDSREVFDLEIEIAQDVISKPRFRLSSLVGWLMPALKFLIEKFAASAVGEIAKNLIALLEKLV